jgi:hypothetical protein
MDPTDPDLQHWNKPFYLVLYMTFCGVVYLQQLPVLYCSLISRFYLLYVCLLFPVGFYQIYFEGFLAHILNNKKSRKASKVRLVNFALWAAATRNRSCSKIRLPVPTVN